MSDRELREAVEQALDWEPMINAKGIGVSVSDGIVTLTGHVPSYAEKREAEKITGQTRGVKAVACELDVLLPSSFERSDEDIARAAADAIAWNTMVPASSVQVWVDKGRVTLEGLVDWQYQRKAAGQCVRYLAGVRDVNNHVVVAPRPDRILVRANVEAALLRDAQLDANRIDVEIRGSRLSLTGTVESWAEREAAEHAAWGTPGVTEVDNRIQVDPIANLVSF